MGIQPACHYKFVLECFWGNILFILKVFFMTNTGYVYHVLGISSFWALKLGQNINYEICVGNKYHFFFNSFITISFFFFNPTAEINLVSVFVLNPLASSKSCLVQSSALVYLSIFSSAVMYSIPSKK